MKKENLRILLLSPKYLAKSELWIWRQIDYLKPYLSFIGVQDPIAKKEHSNIPIINLLKTRNIFRLLINKIKNRNSQQYILNFNINKIAKNYKFNTFYIHYLTQAYQLRRVLLSTEKNIYIHCHGYDVTWNLRKKEFPFDKFYHEEYLNFARTIQHKAIFIANSSFTKRNLMSIGIQKDKIRVLKFGVNTNSLIPKKSNKIIKILFLGRLVDFKGPHNTIYAFEKACDMGLNAELIIAGDGHLMTTCWILKNKSKYKNKIKILGSVTFEQGENLRKECHIFTAHNMKGEITNQVEAYGVSIIEAMASGLPVVAGKIGGVIETVIDGKTGFLFSPGNIEEHALKLYELGINNKLMFKMGAFAKEYVKKEFTIEKEKNDLFNILTMR